MLRVSGYWLLATSILHVLVGLVVNIQANARKSPTTAGSIQLLPIPLTLISTEKMRSGS